MSSRNVNVNWNVLVAIVAIAVVAIVALFFGHEIRAIVTPGEFAFEAEKPPPERRVASLNSARAGGVPQRRASDANVPDANVPKEQPN